MKLRKHRNAVARLERRRKAHGSEENGGRKMPGSMNPKKQVPSGGKKK